MPPRKRRNKHLANIETKKTKRNKKPKIDANDVDPRSFIK